MSHARVACGPGRREQAGWCDARGAGAGTSAGRRRARRQAMRAAGPPAPIDGWSRCTPDRASAPRARGGSTGCSRALRDRERSPGTCRTRSTVRSPTTSRRQQPRRRVRRRGQRAARGVRAAVREVVRRGHDGPSDVASRGVRSDVVDVGRHVGGCCRCIATLCASASSGCGCALASTSATTTCTRRRRARVRRAGPTTAGCRLDGDARWIARRDLVVDDRDRRLAPVSDSSRRAKATCGSRPWDRARAVRVSHGVPTQSHSETGCARRAPRTTPRAAPRVPTIAGSARASGRLHSTPSRRRGRACDRRATCRPSRRP